MSIPQKNKSVNETLQALQQSIINQALKEILENKELQTSITNKLITQIKKDLSAPRTITNMSNKLKEKIKRELFDPTTKLGRTMEEKITQLTFNMGKVIIKDD